MYEDREVIEATTSDIRVGDMWTWATRTDGKPEWEAIPGEGLNGLGSSCIDGDMISTHWNPRPTAKVHIWRRSGWSFEEAKKHTVRERLLERCAAYAGLPCDRRGIEDTEWCERCLAARDLENYEQAVFFIREDYASMDRRGWGSRPGFPEGCHTQAKIDLQRFDRLFTGTRGVSKETAAKLMVSLETELDDVVDSGQVIQYTEGNAPTFFQPAQQYRHTIQFKDGSYDDAVGVHCKVDPDTGAVDVFDTWVAAEECNSSFHVAPGEWRSVRSHKVEDS
jgi:hypothetical protein